MDIHHRRSVEQSPLRRTVRIYPLTKMTISLTIDVYKRQGVAGVAGVAGVTAAGVTGAVGTTGRGAGVVIEKSPGTTVTR